MISSLSTTESNTSALTPSRTHALTFGKSHVTLTLYSIIEFIYIIIYINLLYTIYLYRFLVRAHRQNVM